MEELVGFVRREPKVLRSAVGCPNMTVMGLSGNLSREDGMPRAKFLEQTAWQR